MKQITLKIKDSYYAQLIQYLRSLAYVEIDITEIQPISLEEPSKPAKKKFTIVHIADKDRCYTFNREELYER